MGTWHEKNLSWTAILKSITSLRRRFLGNRDSCTGHIGTFEIPFLLFPIKVHESRIWMVAFVILCLQSEFLAYVIPVAQVVSRVINSSLYVTCKYPWHRILCIICRPPPEKFEPVRPQTFDLPLSTTQCHAPFHYNLNNSHVIKANQQGIIGFGNVCVSG